MKKRLSLLFFVAIIAGCASTTQYHQYPGVESYRSNVAILHVVRAGMGAGGAITAPVYVDGHLIGRIGPGGRLTTKVPPKAISISSTTSSVVLNAKAGMEYYYEISMTAEHTWQDNASWAIYQAGERRVKQLGY